MTGQIIRQPSELGPYADVVEEMDWSVGDVLRALKESGLEENTLVLFTSDNGPWYQGSAGPFRGRKAETYEGGMRVPFLARLPGRIPAGSLSSALATNMDIFPSIAALTGAPLPANQLDGIDIWPLLSGEKAEQDREVFLYFTLSYVQCARLGPWKLHWSRFNRRAWNPDPVGGAANLPLPRPELYNVETDPQESYDCAAGHPEIVAGIRSRIERLLAGFPGNVQSAWTETMRRRVTGTPAGALPVEGTP